MHQQGTVVPCKASPGIGRSRSVQQGKGARQGQEKGYNNRRCLLGRSASNTSRTRLQAVQLIATSGRPLTAVPQLPMSWR